jgi:PAS domain S-box-containing protein
VQAVQARQAALYADITAVFCKPASLSAILNECVEAIVGHLDAAFARIWTLNTEQQVLQLQASAGMYSRLDGSHSRIPVGALKIGLIAEEKTPHLTNDVPNDPRVNDKAWAATEGLVSFAGYPLLVEDKLVGVLGMFARRPLAPDVLDALASIAHLIALSIERTRVEDGLRANEAHFRLNAEHALEETGRRLAAQSDVLTELTATQANGSVPFDERLHAILHATARTLAAERVSVWEFTADRSGIRCMDLFTVASGRHISGVFLLRGRYPRYFEALERERLIAASDAPADQRTSEFLADYLAVNSIGAMLDVPLRQDDVTVGVLCVEHVGGPRLWRTDEQNFALSAANLVVAARADEERRPALAQLAESEARARLIVDTAHDAFVGIDSTGRIVAWNAQAERTFGWTHTEAVGRSLAETIIPPSFREAHLGALRRFHETGAAPIVNQRLELTGLHRSGAEFPIEITITSPIRAGRGFFFGAFLRDISDRRQRDAQLRQAKESAEAATRAKSEFLANMSHELRTPLNGVLGYAQLLQSGHDLSPAQREGLEAISRCGSHLLELINDILDLSRIEAGYLEIEGVVTDLTQMIADLRYVLAESARRQGLRLSMSIAGDVPRRVVLDGRHLRQVLLNLLGNAIKFTPAGDVRLTIAREAEDRLLFEVEDTGIGIAPQALEEIFDAFTQSDAGRTAGGTGLGLAISRRLVKSMGDELKVTSVLGQGSRFFFALPLVRETAGSETDVNGQTGDLHPWDSRLADGSEVTALVADDSAVNRRILAALLESAGVRVITVAGGHEAVQFARIRRPDIMFMDLLMSDLDGLEATRQLHADPATARIPVVAVTASALEQTRQAAFDAGCIEYLPKPLAPKSCSRRWRPT